MKIGEKIRKIRALKGYTQEFVSDKLNISQVAYSDIENDKTNISLNRLEEISHVFGVDLNDILSLDETQIFNNTFKDASNGFFNTKNVINDNFTNERNAYKDQIAHLKEEIIYLRQKFDK